MEDKKQKSFKRICAIAGIIILLSLYVIAFIAAVMDSEYSDGLFSLTIYCSFVIPVLIYLGQVFYKMAAKKKDSEK